MPPDRTGQEKSCAQFGISGAMTPKNPQAWAFEILWTDDGTDFTWFLDNIPAIQEKTGG